MPKYRQPQGKRFFWWIALVILLLGSGFTYLFSLNRFDEGSQMGMNLCLTLTVFGVGMCVIIATADWWLKH